MGNPVAMHAASPRPPAVLMSQPVSMLDVDQDLWQVLDLCTDEELEMVYNCLHDSSPFSPVRCSSSVSAWVEPHIARIRLVAGSCGLLVLARTHPAVFGL